MALTIGQVASGAGVGIETIRFYEREGLLEDPPRTASGYRQYPKDAVTRIQLIRRAKELGFSLKEISELLSLRADPGSSCGDVKRQAQAKIVDMETKIQTLERMKAALEKLVASCDGEAPISECPILESLDAEETK